MALFPLFVEMEGRPCVVLGGGAVAERKVEGLLAAGAVVTVVSPALSPAYGPLAEVAADARRELRAAGRRASAEDWLAALDAGLGALLEGAPFNEAARRLRARLEQATCA